ncbi:MAG: hypothetical protein KIT74_00780 [Fimbriimonadales bacterium]|nr:hypothetical protein [Fimbriimonadales bacterium]
MLTRKEIREKLDRIVHASWPTANKLEQLTKLRDAVEAQIHDLETAILDLQTSLTRTALERFRKRIDRLHLAFSHVNASLQSISNANSLA